ncbi:MAG: hypothetical protein R3C59_04765 [Planctomycetaceae bacterium]
MSNQQLFQQAGNVASGSRAERVLQLYHNLLQSQWADAATICGNQIAQLRTLLRHCVTHVPYYRDLLTEAGVTPDDVKSTEDLRRLPLVDRFQYTQHASQIQAAVLPSGTRQAGTLSTSGTTGIPVIIQNTNVVAEQWLAFAMRDMDWCGLDPRRRLASIRPSGKSGDALEALKKGVTLPTWGQELAAIVDTGISYFMDMATEPQRQLDWLLKVDPDYLLSFPSNVEFLGRLLRDSGRTLPNLKAIQTIGEMLDADMRATMTAAFGVPLFDTYSCCEAGYVASPCPDGHGYHVHAENVIVEVLNDDDQPCGLGETGRIVLTTLHNFATPFIRYDIHDEATVGAERCPCGRGLPLLTSIHGRQRPVFRLPDGRAVNSSPVAQDIRKIGGFLQFQVEQTAHTETVLRIVPGTDWNAERSGEHLRLLRRYFGPAMNCRIECVPRISVGPGQKLQSTMVAPEVSATGSLAAVAVRTRTMFVYACSAPMLLEEFVRSAESFRRHMPHVPRCLWTTRDIDAGSLPDDAFTAMRQIPNAAHQHRPRFEAMLECTAERSVFLDGDTWLCEPVDDLFAVLDHFDIALAAAPQYLHSEAVRSGIYDHLPHVSAAIPEWNGGVIAARVTERFREFVRRWSELFDLCRQRGYDLDQAALRVALATSDLRVVTLPNNYNFRTMMPQVVKGRVKILHAHGNLPTIAARVNSSDAVRVWTPSRQ